MAIHFVTGRPGAGKSFYTMKLLIEELRGTERKIVTNLAVLRDNFAEYLHKKYGETYDLLNRLHIIDDDDIEFFYIHRGLDEPLKKNHDRKGRPESFDIDGAAKTGGIFYILDEVHLKFGARNWQNMGQAATYYASQHRKLGDDVILLTQEAGMCDSQFRALAQDYTVLRNHALENFFMFKQPKIFSRQTFMNKPTANEKPLEKSTFRMDLDIANCYDTAQGVGIHSRGLQADIGQDKRKGLHWGFAVVGGLVLLVILTQLPSACGKVAAKGIRSGATTTTKAVLGDLNQTASSTNFFPKIDTNSTPILEVDRIYEPEPEPEKVMISGYMSKVVNDEWEFVVILETGEILSFQKGEISGITSTHVSASDGTKFYFERAINVLSLRGIEKVNSKRD